MGSKGKINYNEIFNEDLETNQENMSSMTDLIEDMDIPEIESGEVVKGKVTKVARDLVTVDIGFKSEGLIPIEEFLDQDSNLNLKAGEEVDVFVTSRDSRSGRVVLSRTKALYQDTLKKITKAYEMGESVKGLITNIIKGGFSVDLGGGIKAFMPQSQTSFAKDEENIKFIDKLVEVQITEFNRRKSNIVVSRKKAINDIRRKKRVETLPKIRQGAKFTAKIKAIKDYGIFVDIGGVDGLVRLRDLSWSRIKNPLKEYSIDENIEVVVLDYDRENDKLSLGVKQLTEDPWNLTKIKEEDKITGTVIALTDFAAFVELEPGIEGILHVNEMSWTENVKKPSNVVKKGSEIEVIVLSIDKENKKISLSLRRVGDNPWDKIKEKYPLGKTVEAKIVKILSAGIVLDLNEIFEGFIKRTDLTWNKKEKDPLIGYKEADTIKAKVLDYDINKANICLGVKQLSEDPWKSILKRYPKKTSVEGKIAKITDFGIFVELEPGIDGLIHISEVQELKNKKIDQEKYKIGDKIRVAVMDIKLKEKKISLSLKALKRIEEKENLENFIENQEDVKLSLGEMLKDKLK
jgi:small subunit ribosomal protein S1